MIRAGFHAAEASDASLFPVNELRSWKLPFGVVAPPTVKGASFEEDGRPNSWAVVRGESYYIKNRSGSLFDTILTVPLLV